MDPFYELKLASQGRRIKLYKKYKFDKKKFTLNIWFLNNCLRSKKQPTFTKIKLPNHSKTTIYAYHQFVITYIKSEIKKMVYETLFY